MPDGIGALPTSQVLPLSNTKQTYPATMRLNGAEQTGEVQCLYYYGDSLQLGFRSRDGNETLITADINNGTNFNAGARYGVGQTTVRLHLDDKKALSGSFTVSSLTKGATNDSGYLGTPVDQISLNFDVILETGNRVQGSLDYAWSPGTTRPRQ